LGFELKQEQEVECLASKRKVLLPGFKEREDPESFERHCPLCLLLIKTLSTFDFSRP